MFTGIIQGRGKIVEKSPIAKGMRFVLEAQFELNDPEEGESIAVNGVCLTAKQINGRRFAVDVSPESLSRTVLGSLSTGRTVNLERALRLSDRLGGHLVSGHVDATAEVLERRREGDFTVFSFSVPAGLGKYIVEKGSIAINGISLTVNFCDDRLFKVAIIPHTLEVTTLDEARSGDMVNIEVDLIGKYVEKLLLGNSRNNKELSETINQDFLAKHGFLR